VAQNREFLPWFRNIAVGGRVMAADWIGAGTVCEIISQTAKCGALSPSGEKQKIEIAKAENRNGESELNFSFLLSAFCLVTSDL
jgi:hypothetical protein